MTIGIAYGAAVVALAIASSLLTALDSSRNIHATRDMFYADRPL